MTLSLPRRTSYSRYAKLCDQKFYNSGAPAEMLPRPFLKANPSHRQRLSASFSVVGRDKRGNLRFSVPDQDGQFNAGVDFTKVSHKAPEYSFSQAEKYPLQKLIEYEICAKCDLVKQLPHTSRQSKARDTVRNRLYRKTFNKSSSKQFMQTSTDYHPNYSIMGPRNISPVQFYKTSKISTPLYTDKDSLRKVQSCLSNPSTSVTGYIELAKQSPRPQNILRKQFQALQTHQGFNQHSCSDRKIKGMVQFGKQLPRQESNAGERLGPNPQLYQTQTKHARKAHLSFGLFRDRVQTRYDRVGEVPTCRLEYEVRERSKDNLVQMGKTVGRVSPQKYFPVVDPIIKRERDQEIKSILSKYVRTVEINQALYGEGSLYEHKLDRE